MSVTSHLFRPAAAGVMALLCLAPGPSAARPFTIEDLLHQESFGYQAVDPTGRWVVFEQGVPYETGKRYDWYFETEASLSRLMKVDLSHPTQAQPLLAKDVGPGQTIGEFSPSGARLAIYRLRGTRMSLGVVTVATGAVRWFPITPSRSDWGRGLQWISDRELLVIAQPGMTPSLAFREGRVSAQVLPRLWRASATGSGGRTVVGSGAYVNVRPRPAPRLLLRLDVTTGRMGRLATGEFTDLEISPNHQRAALLQTGPDIQPRADGPVQGIMGIADRQQRLSLLDLKTGAQRFPCDPCDVAQHLLSWSPSGSALLVFARTPRTPWSAGRLLRIDAESGRADDLGVGLRPVLDLRPEVIYANWMGEVPLLLARPQGPDGETRADWFRLDGDKPINLTHALPAEPRGIAALDEKGFAALVNGVVWRITATGQVFRLADNAAAVSQPAEQGYRRLNVLARPGPLVVTTTGEVHHLQWLGPRNLEPVLDFKGDLPRALLASRSSLSALVVKTDPHGVSSLNLFRPGRLPQTIAAINRIYGDLDPPIAKPVRHLGPDGRQLTSWLFLPSHPISSPPPLVVQVYLGRDHPTPPQDSPGERGFPNHIQMLTGHGYAVLVASLPLAKGAVDAMQGVGSHIGDIVDAAAADPALRGAFDPSRVALWGHSYGGYTVMAAIAQSQRFKAAVSLSGLSDLISKWDAMPGLYRAMPEEGLQNNWSTGSVESGQEALQVPPWVDPSRYIRNSPLFVAGHIQTPLFLAHGDQDVIPLPQSEAMFSALYRQDKDAILVTYFGEGHAITNPGNVRDLFGRAFAFLDGYLASPVKGAGATPRQRRAHGPANGAPTTLP